ncbi:MAG: hypothetical protein ACLVAT_00790 [Lachnospiraceae bacterium]
MLNSGIGAARPAPENVFYIGNLVDIQCQKRYAQRKSGLSYQVRLYP